MPRDSLLILLVQDDCLAAARLEREITAAGDVVVGPFADARNATSRLGLVQAAILDVTIRDETSFALADSLCRQDLPFVFLGGDDAPAIPTRFRRHRLYPQPGHAGPILHDLHRQHRGIPRNRDDSMEAVVRDMIRRACVLMPDRASADRLVEAALLRAIAETVASRPGDDMRADMMALLDDEYRRRGRVLLH